MQWNYEEAVSFIHAATGQGHKAGLSNLAAMLSRLGNPHHRWNAVHVTGTNGKGSVCAMVANGLQLAGHRVGLYTSPFLQRYNERMRVNGVPIPDDALTACMGRIRHVVEDLRRQDIWPTEFEIGTALAFLHFAESLCDIAVVEVGIGGRLDSTNIITPQLCAIASIGMDHEKILGDTIELIASEKAGIAKPGVPMLLSGQTPPEAQRVVREQCERVGATFDLIPPDTTHPLGLPGAHQTYNAGLARALLTRLAVPETLIDEALQRTRWPGRLEWVGTVPPLLIDGAHNPQGAQSLATYLQSLPKVRTVLLTGIMRDKDWQGAVDALAPIVDRVVAVAPDSRRALDPHVLEQAYQANGVPAECADSVAQGFSRAKKLAGEDGRVVAAGSLYLAGALRTLVLGCDDALLMP